MALVTLRILDGPERGTAYHQVATPITIGREEGNFIQLNDERVSRYHLKIHENSGSILLTDLQSTNGTRVNGEVVQVWHLRPGDMVSVGRSIMIFGSTEEIAKRLAALGLEDHSASVPMGTEEDEFQFLGKNFDKSTGKDAFPSPFELEIFRGLTPEELAPLHLLAPPKLPSGLNLRQLAQMTEFLQYAHLRLRYLVSSVRAVPVSEKSDKEGEEDARVTLSAAEWQNLIDLFERIAKHLHSVTEPTSHSDGH